MAGDILALSHVTSAGLLTATGLTWFLLILAAAAGARFGWLAPVAIFVLYLVMHSGSTHGHANFSAAMLPWILIALACGFIGWQLGGRAILRHLGEREYLTRLSAAQGISSIWKRWFG